MNPFDNTPSLENDLYETAYPEGLEPDWQPEIPSHQDIDYKEQQVQVLASLADTIEASGGSFTQKEIGFLPSEVREEVVALESLGDVPYFIALEGIGRAIGRVVSAILQAVKNFFKRIGAFFRSLIGGNQDAIQYAAYQVRTVDEITGRQPKVDRVSLGAYGAALGTQRKAVTDSRDLDLALQNVEALLTLSARVNKGLQETGVSIASMANGWTENDGVLSNLLDDVNRKFQNLDLSTAAKSIGGARDAGGGREIYGLLPNYRTLMVTPPGSLMLNPIDRARALSTQRIRLYTVPRPPATSNDPTMVVMPPRAIRGYLVKAQRVLEVTAQLSKSVESEHRRIADRIAGGVSKVQSVGGSSTKYMERLAAYNSAYTALVAESQMAIFGYCSIVARNVIRLMASHVRCY